MKQLFKPVCIYHAEEFAEVYIECETVIGYLCSECVDTVTNQDFTVIRDAAPIAA